MVQLIFIVAKNKKEKDLLSLCGEYAVASELCKRGYNASITYGNAKAVDVIVFDDTTSTFKRIEVKTSRNDRFVTSFFQKYYLNNNNKTHPDYWIIVRVDDDKNHFYVLTHDEMARAQMSNNKINEWWIEKPTGVDNVSLKHIEMYENKFDKITFN